MSNQRHQKHFKRLSAPSRRWAHYEAQPADIREWFQQFPTDIWPPNTYPISAATQDETYAKYLAGLRDVWGPDHPAVIDAASRITIRRGKVLELLTIDDLDLDNL